MAVQKVLERKAAAAAAPRMAASGSVSNKASNAAFTILISAQWQWQFPSERCDLELEPLF